METQTGYIVFIVIASVGMIALMLFIVIDILLRFKNRQLIHQHELLILNTKFEKEILEIKNEVTEQVFSDISSELHDDICQTLTLSVYQINQSAEFNGTIDQYISNSRINIQQAISDLRNLSHTLSGDYWKNFDLYNSLNRLNEKLNNTNRIKTDFNISPYIEFDSKDQEIILIRIIQELINNSLKHSRATLIKISLTSGKSEIILDYNDNGIGFIENKKTDGLGMISIHQRMKLLNARWQIISENGFSLDATIPITLKV